MRRPRKVLPCNYSAPCTRFRPFQQGTMSSVGFLRLVASDLRTKSFSRSSYWFAEYCVDPTRDEKVVRLHSLIRFHLLPGNPRGLEHQIIHNVRIFHARTIDYILATFRFFQHIWIKSSDKNFFSIPRLSRTGKTSIILRKRDTFARWRVCRGHIYLNRCPPT